MLIPGAEVTQDRTIDWMNAYYDRALAAGDQQRLRLPQMTRRILNAYSNNPGQAFVLIDEALTLAKNLQEPCWTVIFNTMRVDTYVFRMFDLPAGLRAATEAVVALRKPEYQHCAGLVKIYDSLLTAYLYIDPYGYRDKILDALDFMETSFDLDPATRGDVKLRRLAVALACEDYETAFQYGLEALSISGDQLDNYLMLSYTAHQRHDLQAALTYTQLGEKCHRAPGAKGDLDLVQLLGYQAFYLLRLGEIEAAEDVRLHAYRLLDKVQSEPYFTFYEAMSGYYEVKGDLERAIGICHDFIHAAERHGSTYANSTGHVLLCRLSGKAGKPLDAALVDAREAFKRLIDPSLLLKKLERIENGDYSPD
jgi:hypothetical protein